MARCLKSCDIENVDTGERFTLIDKVMASISNPELRRMELMSTIVGIEGYVAEAGDFGMFITITTPSKYHPTRAVGEDKDKREQFNRAIKEDGELLTDSATAVTAWAATWCIPQFHPIGLPKMGAYHECRSKALRSIILSDSFDDEVEAVRADDFAAYLAAQGGANVARKDQTVRVARRVADELNSYEEGVQKVVGIFAPHLGEAKVFETRTTQ